MRDSSYYSFCLNYLLDLYVLWWEVTSYWMFASNRRIYFVALLIIETLFEVISFYLPYYMVSDKYLSASMCLDPPKRFVSTTKRNLPLVFGSKRGATPSAMTYETTWLFIYSLSSRRPSQSLSPSLRLLSSLSSRSSICSGVFIYLY